MQSTTNRVEVSLIPIMPTKGYNLWKTRLKGLYREVFQKGRSARGHHARAKTSKRVFVFFCDLEDREENLHTATTFQLNKKVKHAAIKTGNEKIMAKLSEGDMVATEAVYHQKCLISLYNAQRSCRTKECKTENQGSLIYGIVLSERNGFVNVWSTIVTSQQLLFTAHN